MKLRFSVQKLILGEESVSFLCFISEIYNPLSDRRRYGVFVSGGLHWLLPRSPDLGTGNSIVAFDLSAEAFSVLAQPDNSYFEKDDVLDLAVLMGRLCLVSIYDEAILDVWMMKEYRVTESWIKLISIDRSNTANSFSFLNPLPYSEWGGDEIVLEVDEELVLYDLKRESVKTLKNLFVAEEEQQQQEEQEKEEEGRRTYGVFVSGVLHWLFPRSRELGKDKSIVAFDVSAEVYSVLPQPDYFYFEIDAVIDLVVVDGRLCLICRYEPYDEGLLDVWMMNEYGVKEFWFNLVLIDRSNTWLTLMNQSKISQHSHLRDT